jgi:hypothetical protein
MQDRLKLACIQAPPLPLLLVIMQAAQLPTFRAFPWRILCVPPMHVHCAFLQLQLYPLYTPRTLDSQYLPRQLPVFHPSEFATPQPPAADSATTFPEFPNNERKAEQADG